MIAERRKLDVIIGVIGQLFGFFGVDIVNEKIHCTVTIRQIIYFVAVPHGENVLVDVICDLCCLLCFKVIYPDLIGHATLVIFPRSELTENPVIGHFLPVR